MSDAAEVRAILHAYRQLSDAWTSLPRVPAERAAKWAGAGAEELRRELAGYVTASSAPSCGVRLFWKLGAELTYGGANAHVAADAGLPNAEALIGIDDTDRRLPWRGQAAKYRADDRVVMKSRRANLDIVERQDSAAGATTWLHTGKVPICTADECLGVLCAYEVLDHETGKRLFAQTLRKTAKV